MCVGAVTDSSARFAVVVDGGGPVRIAVDTDPAVSSPVYSSSVAVDAQGAAIVDVTGLTADTRYYWQVEDNSVLDTSVTGQLLTDPVAGEPASFVIGVCGDAGLSPTYPGVTGSATNRLSNHPIFDLIRERALDEGWRRVAHLGDACYYDLGSGNHGLSASATAAQYRGMWDDILAQPRQAQLYREVPWVYAWDDHDFGPNNSDSTSPGRDNACTVYRERVPSYDLPAGSGANPIYHSFALGRVLFVVSDVRADREPGTTMLGAAQLAWIDSLLETSDAAALVWLMPVPWLGPSADSWGGFGAERASIVEMLGDHGWLDRMLMVSADKHVLALDSGSHPDAGGFPNMLCASLDATPGSYTSQYDGGMWPGRGQYGTVAVHDTGGDVVITATAWAGATPVGSVWATTSTRTTLPTPSASHVLAL